MPYVLTTQYYLQLLRMEANLHAKSAQDGSPNGAFKRLTQAYEDVRRYASAENISLKKRLRNCTERIAARKQNTINDGKSGALIR